VAVAELDGIVQQLRAEDVEFEAERAPMLSRDGYEIDPTSSLPAELMRAARAAGASPGTVGMTFWTDAAILGAAGIPSAIFGPGGAGLHSTEEYVVLDDVHTCCAALTALARQATKPR
jgi:acetylornithine deacetylase